MKYIKSLALMFVAAMAFTACEDEVKAPGDPSMAVSGNLATAYFGDSLSITVQATDPTIPLSTIHADLYYGSEMVSQRIIRTKENGDYSFKLYVPYYANIPDGEATLKLTLQNINFTTTEQVYNVAVSHADYSSLKLVTDDGAEYTMRKTDKYVYEVKDRFPQQVKAKIVAPAMGENGNEITFGYENDLIKVGADKSIPFSNASAGKYTISFNTFSFEGAPFVELLINGQNLYTIDDNNFGIDLTLNKGDQITPSGFPDFNEWFINPDFFAKNGDGTLTFNAYQGSYRIIANMPNKYFQVQVLNGSEKATLNEDGSGALWILGDGLGYPSIANQPGWNPGRAICMAPVAPKVYQVTGVGGKTLAANSINFKFFGQDGWGTELTGADLVSTSNLIGVGDGVTHDNGNLYMMDGVELQENGVYVITVDCSQGIHEAVMSVEFAGEQQFEEKVVKVNGIKMTTSDNTIYSAILELHTGDQITFDGFSGIDDIYVDQDYFNYDDEEGTVTFLPIDGFYNITLNKTSQLKAAKVAEDGSQLTLNEDGTGALYLMGWGVGSPDQNNQFGWNPGASYCMAQVAPGVYQFTGTAGPENGSQPGDRIRFDYVSFKFFHQDGWGGEFGPGALTMTGDTATLLKNDGNFEYADGVNLEAGATYQITVDLSAGIENGTINLRKI